MAGRKAGAVVNKYPGLQVQASSYGINQVIGWGTFRARSMLLDYLDFTPIAQKTQQQGAGKGGNSQVSGYTYTATLLIAALEGQIDNITQVWIDNKTFAYGSNGSGQVNTANATALAQAGLSLATGAIGQAVWSYLTTNHPDHAIGYSGLAYVYAANYPLDTSAAPPNHSFEIVRVASFGVGSTPDADPSLVVTDLFTNVQYGVPGWGAGLLGSLTQYQNYTLAAGLLLSPDVDAPRAYSDFLAEMLKATNSDVVWSEGVLKFFPYGDTALTGNGKTYTPAITPAYSLDADDFKVAATGDPPIFVDIEDQADAYNIVQVEFLDRQNQYNTAVLPFPDPANVAQFGERKQDATSLHVIKTRAVVAIAGQLLLQRTLYVRAKYRFMLGWQFILLEPGIDILQVTDPGLGLSNYGVRILEIEEDEQYGYSLICEDFPQGTGNTPLYVMQHGAGTIANQNVDPGGVEGNLLLYSEDFTNAAWTKTRITPTGGITDPFGFTNADSLAATAVNNTHFAYQDAATFDGLNYTLPIWLKKNTRKIARVKIGDTAFANYIAITVDLNTGTVYTAAGAVGTAVLIDSAMEDASSITAGWWRITLVGQFPGSTTLRTQIDLANDSGNFTWTGDGTHGVYAYGGQLYQGLRGRAYAATLGTIAGPLLFNPPSVLSTSPTVWAAVAGGPNWGGCNVWVSTDNSSYSQVGTIDAPARYGITGGLASHADPDTVDTCNAYLGVSNATLEGVTQLVADTGGTMCLIDDELICYEDATLFAPNNYTLGTYLRRGFLGTTIAAHAVDARIIRLDEAVFNFPYFKGVQSGQLIYVKFQSFNGYGRGVQDLADCNVYTAVPVPLGGAAPAAADWTATAGVLANMGQSQPAIIVSGASGNPAATALEFDIKITGAGAWVSTGLCGATATGKNIVEVQSGQTYDVSVVYWVNGTPTDRQIIATGITVGSSAASSSGGGAGVVPGQIIYDSWLVASGALPAFPAGTYTHVDVVLAAAAGYGDSGIFFSGPFGDVYYASQAGGAGVAVKLNLLAGPGYVLTRTLAAFGADSTCSGTGLAMTAHCGTSGSGLSPGSGGTASGGTNNYTGHGGGEYDDAGNLVAGSDGAAADINGTYQTNAAIYPGIGAKGYGGINSGSGVTGPGSGARLLVIARA